MLSHTHPSQVREGWGNQRQPQQSAGPAVLAYPQISDLVPGLFPLAAFVFFVAEADDEVAHSFFCDARTGKIGVGDSVLNNFIFCEKSYIEKPCRPLNPPNGGLQKMPTHCFDSAQHDSRATVTLSGVEVVREARVPHLGDLGGEGKAK